MRAHLVHGFNVTDGGRGSIGKMAPYLMINGNKPKLHSYGWVGLLLLRLRTQKAIDEILPQIEERDVLVGHSHGCLINWRLIQAGARPSAVICFQPAMRRDTPWPEGLPVLCFYNRKDWIVSLGRAWGRFVSVVNPWANRHGWGAAGRHGFDQASVDNRSTLEGPTPAECHSQVFQEPSVHYWGMQALRWLRSVKGAP